MPLAYNPYLTVYLYDVVCGKFFHIHEAQCRKTGEDEKVAYQREGGTFKLVLHDGLYLVLGQILTLFHIRTDVELRKRISRYHSVVVCTHHYSFQPHAMKPYRGVLQSSFIREVCRKLLDEIGCEFQHRHIGTLVERLDESRHIVPRTHHHLICADGTVLAHTFEEVGAVLVKCPDKRFILAADTLIGVAHHLRCHERFTVG